MSGARSPVERSASRPRGRAVIHEVSGQVRHRHRKPTARQAMGRFDADAHAIVSGSTRTAHTLNAGIQGVEGVSACAPVRWKGMKTVSARSVSVSLTLAGEAPWRLEIFTMSPSVM